MNRLEKLKRSIGKMTIDDFFIRNKPGWFEADADVLENSYNKSDLCYICISTTAKAISQVDLKLGRVNGQGEWEEISPNMSGWYEILKRPNYLQDYYSFIEAIVTRLMLDGNAWVAQYPLESPQPFSLWVLQKKHIQAVKNDANQLIAWNYIPGPGVNIQLEIADVAHVFFYNPYDPIIGFAPLDAGGISIVTDYKAAKFNQIFFDQGASIGGVLSTEQGLTDAQFKRLKEEIEQKYTGYDKAHRMLLLDGGLKFAQTSPTHKDMMLPDLRALDKERILQIFGMKKAVISVTDDLNRATAWQQERSWWRNTNVPIMNLIASALNFTFFEKEGLEARFDLSNVEALQIDFADKVETAVKLVEMGFTANEVNEKLELGFDYKKWRDYFFIPNTVRPVGEDIDVIEEPELIDEPEEEPVPQLPAPEEPEEEVIDIQKEQDFQSRGEKIWKGVVDKVKPIEKVFHSKTKKMFFEWRKLVLEWLFAQAIKSAKDERRPFLLTSPLTDIDELSIEPFEKLKDSADELYEESLMLGLETIGLEIGTVLDIDILSLPTAQAFLIDKKMDLKGLTETQSKNVRRSLSRGMERGESLEELANRIRFDFTKAATRAKTIARTEIYGALNSGRNTTIKETNFTKVQWFTSLDEKVRQTHSEMHGRKKRINQMWVVGGSQIQFPGDPRGAPGEVINCRCIEMVVLDSLI